MGIKKKILIMAACCLLVGCNNTTTEPKNEEENRIMHDESVYENGVNFPKSLWEKPEYYFDESTDIDGIKGLYIRSDYKNEKSYAFAYLGFPETEKTTDLPAVLLLHGGGGTAYYEWVKAWNEKGFIALAVDLEGHVPLKTGHMTSYPQELYVNSQYSAPHNVNLNDGDKPIDETWLYYATKTAIISNSFLHNLEIVNKQKIGLCGVSWGGYISSIIAGYDDRFDYVIPIYCMVGMEESGSPIGEYVKNNTLFRVFDDLTPLTLVDTPIHAVVSNADIYQNIYRASENLGLCKNATLSIIDKFTHSQFDAVNQIEPYEFALSETENKDILKVNIEDGILKLDAKKEDIYSIELFETDENSLSSKTLFYLTELEYANEIELTLDSNTTYYYVSIHDAKNSVISSKVFKI